MEFCCVPAAVPLSGDIVTIDTAASHVTRFGDSALPLALLAVTIIASLIPASRAAFSTEKMRGIGMVRGYCNPAQKHNPDIVL